jgi:hypothetical protein
VIEKERRKKRNEIAGCVRIPLFVEGVRNHVSLILKNNDNSDDHFE